MSTLSFKDISQQEAIENVKAVLSSSYFSEYDVAPHSHIETDRLAITHIGRYSQELKRMFTLGEVAASIDAVIDQVAKSNPTVGLHDLVLGIKAPDALKARFGFSPDRAEELSMHLLFAVIAGVTDERSMTGRYTFEVERPGLRREKYADLNLYRRERKRYQRWLSEVDAALRSTLPGLRSPQS